MKKYSYTDTNILYILLKAKILVKRGIVQYERLLYNYFNLPGHESVLQLEDSEADPEQSLPPFDGLGLLH